MALDFDHLKKVYFEECQDLLQIAEEHLSAIASGQFESEDIHAVFRSVHSIKGGAGSFGFNALVTFAHTLETLLDYLRDERIELTTDIGDLLLRGNDVLSDFVKEARDVSGKTPGLADKVKAQLESAISAHSGVGASVKGTTEPVANTQKENTSNIHYKVSFVPKITLMEFGNEPLLLLRELRTLSSKDKPFDIKIDTSKVPDITKLQADSCYFSWEIEFFSDCSQLDIKEVFEFVEDDCTLTITVIEDHVDAVQTVTSQSAGAQSPSSPKNTTEASAKTDEVVQSIRVDLDRIDKLVNTVGEMVIKQAMVLDRAALLNDDGDNDLLTKGLQELTQHTRDLQESVMAIRAQPVKAVFSRVPRLVRELSSDLHKDIQVIMHGENTEIDKTVIEKLGEPLTHMIRNSVDHGIETPDERIAAGKPAQGTIQMLAEHRNGRIVIEISDNGKGINRKRVLQKALENGLISQEQSQNLSGDDIDNLIFLPGFSTAQEITNISGRGVGMDVVKRSIQSLGGRVSISSVEGHGCKFTMTLPLTLAVLDGMIVTCADQTYVIPLISIIETVRPKAEQITHIVGLHDILHLRGQNIPLVYLYRAFNIKNALKNSFDAIVVVVETEGGEPIGLVVDDLLYQQQVVIKSLEANYDPIEGVSAATILGNGRIALILDMNALKTINASTATIH